uniref:Uncharacterized protein n=1 Tax=Neogobius melanostomus TaxID=47308 RepID=A0A8C6U485_9GOBI
MQKSRVIISCLLALVLSCDSTHQKLKSLNDLKDIDFERSVPKHGLLLLHWFANVINIDNNNVLRLTFDPNTEDFGSHHYGNYENMLDPLPRGYRYFTVGNLYEETSNELPEYVLHPPVREYEGNNMDRILFRVTNSGVHIIDQVYLTQHYRQHEQQGTRYNPDHTYRISNSLLQQIRTFSVENNHMSLRQLRDRFHSNADDSQFRDIRNTWGKSLACLGLLLFIVIQEKHSKNKPIKNTPEKRHPSTVRRTTQPDYVVNMPDERYTLFYPNQSDQVHLEITTGGNGKATIVWRNVSRHKITEGAAVVLFQRDQEASSAYKLIMTSEGIYNTSVPLTEGLQVRLHKARRTCFFWTKLEEEICRGPEFQSPDPVSIADNAFLQLFVRDGKACARLFVKRSFRQWKSEFKQSWVGFYTSADRCTEDYEWWQWQWVTKFQQGPDVGDYNTLEYCSGLTIAPGVQTRFILKDYQETARITWQ